MGKDTRGNEVAVARLVGKIQARTVVDKDGAVGGDVIVEILVAHELYVEAAAVGLTELAPFAKGLCCRHPLRHGNGNGEK